jgi:hypothetical protein
MQKNTSEAHFRQIIQEKAIYLTSEQPGRREFRCRLVRAGRVRAVGNQPGDLEIAPQALETACTEGLFEGKAVFLDHANFSENPSMKNLVGVTAHTRYDPQQTSVEGIVRLYETPIACVAASLLDGILSDGQQAPDVGLSLVFWPVYDPDKSRIVTGIRHVESVDLVFEPAADGRVLQALSANDCALAGINSHGGENMENQSNDVGTSDAGVTRTNIPNLGWEQALAETAAGAMISASDLPQASRQRLAGGTYQNPQQVNAAIAAERAYLAALQEDQVVQMSGTAPRSPQVSGGRTGMDQVSMALEALLVGRRPADGIVPLSGIRELYHLLSGDYEMNGLFHSERVYLANVNSATMAGLVANALNKRVVNEFMQYPMWWQPIVSEEDFNSLQAVKWITLGGVGELPTVAEGAAYTELAWDDQTETASFVKKGGYLGLTLEAIDKDDTGRLRSAPRALAQAAWLTLAKTISGVFTDNSGTGPTMSDNQALFHTNHGNLVTTALSVSSYATTRTAMRKQTEVNSGERLGALTAPRLLLVPPDLEITALQVLASQYDYTYALSNGVAAPQNTFAEGNTLDARMNAARQRVIVVDLWTDTNNWAAAADPNLYPTIGVAYRYGRTPEVFSVASPTAGLMFTNDTMPIKVRFFFAAGPMDWRGLYKANVA